MTWLVYGPVPMAAGSSSTGKPSRYGTDRSGPRLPRFPFLLVSLLAVGVQLSAQQADPVSNFCRRFGHQTTVVDDRLYVDGGFINYNPLEQNPQNYTNDNLFFHDLSSVANSGMPQLYANLSKNHSVPSLHGGVLWGDPVNKRVYQFGGEFHQDQTTPFRGIYAYDILHDQWDYFPSDHTDQPQSTVIRRPSYGAGVAVPERGEGYHYGGWISNRSEARWGDAQGATPYLVKYEMDRNLWTNSSGPDGVGRAEGSMVYIPAGDAGMLVYLGGVQDKHGNGTEIEGQPMDEIFLYDVLSFKWYKQQASGEIPPMRRRFCSGVVWAADRSSYNIYLYGGAGMPPNTAGFDDVYILTLPTFTWIKMYPDTNGTGEYPHHSLSCNVVNRSTSQMLIIGGTFPLTDMCDTPDQWGVHGLDLGRQNKDGALWQLYEPGKADYEVPWDITDVIGGSGAGGATDKEPVDGFDSNDVRVLLGRTASAATREPTRDVGGETGSTNKLSKGAIIGIAIGCAAVVAAILLGCVLLLRRRQRRKSKRLVISAPQPQEMETPHTQQGGFSPGVYYERALSSPGTVGSPSLPPVGRATSPIELAADHEHPVTSIHYEAVTPTSDQTKVEHSSWASSDNHPLYSTMGKGGQGTGNGNGNGNGGAGWVYPTSPVSVGAVSRRSVPGVPELSATPGVERHAQGGEGVGGRRGGRGGGGNGGNGGNGGGDRVHQTFYHA